MVLGLDECEDPRETLSLGEAERLGPGDCVGVPLRLPAPLLEGKGEEEPPREVGVGVVALELVEVGDATEEGLALESDGRADLDSRGEGLELTDKEKTTLPRGDLDVEGEWVPDPLCEGEPEVRWLGEGVACNVPAEDKDESRELAVLPLGWGVLDTDREARAEAEWEGLGDTVRVPMLVTLSLGERLMVALGREDLDGDTVALLEREGWGLFEAEEVWDREGGLDPDLTPDPDTLWD